MGIRSVSKTSFVVLAFLCFSFAGNSQEPIDIETLLKDVAVDSQKDAFSGYTYKLEFVRKKSSFMGTQKLIRRYEVILPTIIPKNRVYQHPLLLTYDNSRDWTPNDIALEKKRIIKILEQIENGADEFESIKNKKENPGGYVTLGADSNTVGKQPLKISVIELISNSTFTNPEVAIINGRETVSLDFRPKQDAAFDLGLFYLGYVEGRILVDKEDKRVVSVEAFPIGKFDAVKDLAESERELARIFYYRQIRVAEGFWFPETVRLNLLGAPQQFNEVDAAIEFSFSEYKRFTVHVQSADVEKLPEPVEEEVVDPETGVAQDTIPPQ